MSEPTFLERVEAATRELAAVTATAEHRRALRQRDGRALAPALRAQLAELSSIASDAAAILADLSYGTEAVDRAAIALAEVEQAARAAGYHLTAYDTMPASTPLRDHPGGRSRSTSWEPGTPSRHSTSLGSGAAPNGAPDPTRPRAADIARTQP